jgi:hypothetical protein
MAGVLARACTGQIALSAATAKNVFQLRAPTNQRVLIREIQIAFEGIDPTDAPVLVEFGYNSADGTFTSLTPVKANRADNETLQATCHHTATVAPTTVTPNTVTFTHPQAGFRLLLSKENAIHVVGGDGWGIRLTAPDAVDCIVTVGYEE